jgi:DNA topoisomerase-1
MKLVIVESPAKAKTINKYLGNDFKVLASYGHVRALPSKTGSVNPDEDFYLKYELTEKADRHVKELIKCAKDAKEVLLATDPDREGEAISWHIKEILEDKIKSKNNIIFNRICFNEITKKSVLQAVASPRQIDMDLVNAQQARQALDYLVGFSLSPILWTKIPGCRSAGRVQSVSLKLICEREYEIEKFVSKEYWSINVELLHKRSKILARLIIIEGHKLDKFDITNADQANKIVEKLSKATFYVSEIEEKEQRRNPPSPFTTSLLQQEASRKLGFTAKKTMTLAQKLYEGITIDGQTSGLITYMRTDGVSISEDAIKSIRNVIKTEFGSEYVPKAPRLYKAKAKNAQEAHEAIRPTDITVKPKSLQAQLDKDLWSLYNLIWQRTLACQMENAIIDMVSVDVTSEDKNFVLRANGHTIKFEGFYKIYSESVDDADEEAEKALPKLNVNDALENKKVDGNQHFTQPPPRYGEASLVKKMEELGIGRPSTYATIISVLQDRKYVTLEKKRFIPEDHGRIVIAFLQHYFSKYLEYDFTASLENDLDEIASGKLHWKKLLQDFWQGFNTNITEVKQYKITDIINTLDQDLSDFLFPQSLDNGQDVRLCKKCSKGHLSLRFGKFGPFIACSEYPTCSFSRKLSAHAEENDSVIDASGQIVGNIEEKVVYLRKGPYGLYLQLGENNDKPKRISLSANLKVDQINIEEAKWLFSLPMVLGEHPTQESTVALNIGRFGFYFKCGDNFVSLGKEDPKTVSLERAIEIIDAKLKNPRIKKLKATDNKNAEATKKSAKITPAAAKKPTKAAAAKAKTTATKSKTTKPKATAATKTSKTVKKPATLAKNKEELS